MLERGGLWILKYTPGTKGTVSWTADRKNVVVKYQKKFVLGLCG